MTVETSDSLVTYVTYTVPPSKQFAWLDSDVKQHVTTQVYAAGNNLEGRKVLVTSKKNLQVTTVGLRESNPFDVPPDVGYEAKRRLGEYMSHKSYDVRSEVIDQPLWAFRTNGNPWYEESYLSMVNQLSFLPDQFDIVQIGDAYRQAVLNLYGSLSKRQKLAGGVFLAELSESVGLVGKASLAIFQIVRALKKGRVSEALRVIRDYGSVNTNLRGLRNRSELARRSRQAGEPSISKSKYASKMWLELQFGWIPIMNDINDLITTVTEGLISDELFVHVSGYGSETRDFKTFMSHEIAPNTRDVIGVVKEKVKMSINASFTSSDTISARLQAIGLLNPLSIAWEIVPFSFVIDWFIPVGRWLDTISVTAGLTFIEASQSVKTERNFVFQHKALSNPGPLEVNRGSLSFDQKAYSNTFLRLTGLDLPDFPTPRISFAEFLQPWKIVTSLALLKSLFGR